MLYRVDQTAMTKKTSKFEKENKAADKFFTERFNSKDQLDREEAGIYCLQTQINQIKIERLRLKENYQRADREALDQLKNCERSLRVYFREEQNKLIK